MEAAIEGLPSNKQPTIDGEPNITYWFSEIDGAKLAAKVSIKATQEAVNEYLGPSVMPPSVKDPQIKESPTRYPIFWSSIRTIQPALYSQTPIPVAEKVFTDLDDNQSRLGSKWYERLAKYLIRSCPYDRVQYATRDTFIWGGKVTERVFFDSSVTQEVTKVYYAQVPTGMDPNTQQPIMGWVDDKGQPPQEGVELQQDEEGVFAETVDESLDYACVDLLPVHFRDILHTANARHWEEVDWIAFKSLMNRQDVTDRFGPEIAADVPYETINTNDDNKETVAQAFPQLYAKIWEIWDKREEKVYWLAENYKAKFLDVKDDIYELDGFFPCPPFMLGTIGPDSMFPVPDYVQLRPMIDQLHAMARRLKTLVRAARRRGLYDSSIPELKSLADEADEAEFIGVGNFQQQIVGKGGIENVVAWFPQQEIVEAIQQMAEIISMYENKFNEIYGIPDIVRGVSEPNRTAAEQQLIGDFHSLRFSAVQREFQRLNRDAIELMCDLALKKLPEQKLAEIMGISHEAPEDQALWPQVLIMLRDDSERKIRIDIETDSTITMNQNQDIEQRNYLAKTLFEGLTSVIGAMQGNPAFAPVAMETLLYVVSGVQKGKDIEATLRKSLQQAMQPQQPPPDPAMIKAQADMAIQKQKTDADIQVAQVKTQADISIEWAKTQAEMYREDRKAAHDVQFEQLDAMHQQQLKDTEANLSILKASLANKVQEKKAENDMTVKMVEATKPEPKQHGDVVNLHLGPQTSVINP